MTVIRSASLLAAIVVAPAATASAQASQALRERLILAEDARAQTDAEKAAPRVGLAAE